VSLLAALSELLLYNSFFFVQDLCTIRLSQQSSVVLCLSGGDDVVHMMLFMVVMLLLQGRSEVEQWV